jgi:hypothetical protein
VLAVLRSPTFPAVQSLTLSSLRWPRANTHQLLARMSGALQAQTGLTAIDLSNNGAVGEGTIGDREACGSVIHTR